MSKPKEKELNYVFCVLENSVEVLIEIPEDNWEDAFNELLGKIKTGEMFSADNHCGIITINDNNVDYLNCKKVIALKY